MTTVWRVALLLAAASLRPLLADTPSTPAPFAGPLISPVFTDNMVLQRGQKDPIWGWATPGSQVTVTVETQTAGSPTAKPVGKAIATTGPDGRWQTSIGPLSTGPTYTIQIDGPQSTSLHNIVVGDVWILTGQSNMEFGVDMSIGGNDAVAKSSNENIRLLRINHAIDLEPASVPLVDGGGWEICSPDTLSRPGWGGFSAIGYYFGRELQGELNVPIGLIQDPWGGTPIESWISADTLKTMPGQTNLTTEIASLSGSQLDYIGNIPHVDPGQTVPGAPSSWTQTALYNGMIVPVAPLGIKGALWYQGESNASHGLAYRALMPALISDWRKLWGEGDFPFYIVSLASFQQRPAEPAEDGWAEVREGQALAAKNVHNCGLAISLDYGNATDIHPKDKQPVAHRLALVALANAYGRNVPFAGPWYKSMKVEKDTIRIRFDDIDGGLVVGTVQDNGSPIPPDQTAAAAPAPAGSQQLLGFEIAGADHKFVWASAIISGKDVVVSSPQVPDPVNVRYGWAANPACNLYNQAGLPAVPFRTDDPLAPAAK